MTGTDYICVNASNVIILKIELTAIRAGRVICRWNIFELSILTKCFKNTPSGTNNGER